MAYPEKLIRQRNLVAAKNPINSIWSDLGDKLRRQKGPFFDYCSITCCCSDLNLRQIEHQLTEERHFLPVNQLCDLSVQ